MKLIFGLLALLSIGHCDDNAATDARRIGARPFRFLSLPKGFPDGTQVTFIFKKTKDIAEAPKAYLNFYDTTNIDPNAAYAIPAHITVSPAAGSTITTASFDVTKAWQGNEDYAQTIIDAAKLAPWWRVDVYKLDATHMNVAVQGFWANVRTFTLPLDNIKTIYIFGDVEIDNIFTMYRYPSRLVKPTPFVEMDKLVKAMTEPAVAAAEKREVAAQGGAQGPVVSTPSQLRGETTFNIVELAKFPLKKRLRITAWMGSKPQGTPMLQFVPAGYKQDADLKEVFTIYQKWDVDPTKGRKSYIDLFNKFAATEDKCMADPAPCAPVDCVADGMASDVEHYLIQRTSGTEIQVSTYYAGAADVDPPEGKIGAKCKITLPATAVKLDEPFEIHGLNGATILHADTQWA